MLLEVLLPPGMVDPGLRAPFHRAAAPLEEIGCDGLVVEETNDDPFILLAPATQTTGTLKLDASAAIAFPRSPTMTGTAA